MSETIIQNLRTIQQRIKNACIKSNRDINDVKLLLATKTVDANRIKIAIEKGETLIGENKVQEVKQKYDELKNTSHQKHFIGHLQTNKIKEILKYNVSCIQSLDRISLAEKLQKRLEFEDKTINAFMQVNTSAEESKFGVTPNEAVNLVKELANFDRIHIKGLMTIGLFSADEEKVRTCFKLLKSIQQEIIAKNIPNIEMKELSMGMSGDLEIAIEEGATIVRVGTAIFGERIYPDSYYWNEKIS
ncbi:alanine racemase [Tenacibaculum holothuriorum]|uniref:Pyridoxal phosphate homeostasis protein n=1 Tax=Tenacibaculum holothuriorum TaxID=1635173 RepID=A0A1Y2PDZ1_9FLAO|nr:YggS family pyridoxal phosphate-dependent enzyme [Tenacibaculum holothuriorum]OSY87949.1 alanine racemase [Tenacibaculum holothuriorum]